MFIQRAVIGNHHLHAPDCPYHAYDWEAYAIQVAGDIWDAGMAYTIAVMNAVEGVEDKTPDKTTYLQSLQTKRQ